MKAITIWQPWATLLAYKIKRYETRGWATKYRGPMAIHAAAKPLCEILSLIPSNVLGCMRLLLRSTIKLLRLEDLPLGKVVATAELIACHEVTPEFVESLSPYERMFGDFTIGRYAWEFKDMTPLEDPVPAKGGQLLWNWNPGLLDQKGAAR